ncbi:MAG: ABC transporter ATP-binding protein [Bergeyella sp.]|nr:ABC transporter ATP-binding protein [Bergeyella sp.]
MNSLRSLNSYFWKYRLQIFLGLSFIVLSNFFTIFRVQYVGKSVDIIADSQSSEWSFQISKYVLIIIFSSLFAGFFTFMMRQTIIVASRKIEYELKNKIYRHYQEISLTDYKKNTIGDFMNRLSEDVVAVRMYLGPGVMYIINTVVLVFITGIYMLKTEVQLTLWALVPLPVLAYLIFKVSSVINRKSKNQQKKQSEISTLVTDSFSGIRVIKFFAKELFVDKIYKREVLSFQKGALDLAKTEAYFYTIILLILGLLNVIILYVGGIKYINGEISVGKIADFFMYINILIFPVSMVGWVTSVNQRAEASMQRINEFLNLKSEIRNQNFSTYPIKGNIEFRNVSYVYPNTGIRALDKVNFSLSAGESLAIMGKTGSGKTTLALLLSRLIEPTEGEILLDGKNLKEHNLVLYRSCLGYVPQESYLFSETVEKNIGFAVDNPSFSAVVEYAKKADVHKDIEGFTWGYQTLVGERGVALSGGQKQRICIARALIKKPSVLIFDDVLSALDTKTERKVLDNIAQEISGHTTVIITHRESTAQKADRILYLDS